MALRSASRVLGLAVTVAVAASDQIAKHWIRSRLEAGAQVPIVPGFLNLSHVQNEGAAWGLFQGIGPWLIPFSIAILAVMLLLPHSPTDHPRLASCALGLLMGGIVGNLIDRIRLGYVVDFLDFHWRSWHFPSFNIADSAICAGVALYLWIHHAGPHRREAARTSEPGSRAG